MLHSLTLQGVRSYSDEFPQTIEFFRPLTIILGKNGSGKTTILEALNYALTSTLPPLSDLGKRFVHDPLLSMRSGIKGKIVLQASNGVKLFTITRRFELTIKGGKKAFKTLDGSLDQISLNHDRHGNVLYGDALGQHISSAQHRGGGGAARRTQGGGGRSTASTRASDLLSDIPALLGISSSMMQHVLFVHHEESCWPLYDDKRVKERFDSIFSSSHYNDLLHHLRQHRRVIVDDYKTALHQVELHQKDYSSYLSSHDEIERNEHTISNLLVQKHGWTHELERIHHTHQTFQSAVEPVQRKDIDSIQQSKTVLITIDQQIDDHIDECGQAMASELQKWWANYAIHLRHGVSQEGGSQHDVQSVETIILQQQPRFYPGRVTPPSHDDMHSSSSHINSLIGSSSTWLELYKTITTASDGVPVDNTVMETRSPLKRLKPLDHAQPDENDDSMQQGATPTPTPTPTPTRTPVKRPCYSTYSTDLASDAHQHHDSSTFSSADAAMYETPVQLQKTDSLLSLVPPMLAANMKQLGQLYGAPYAFPLDPHLVEAYTTENNEQCLRDDLRVIELGLEWLQTTDDSQHEITAKQMDKISQLTRDADTMREFNLTALKKTIQGLISRVHDILALYDSVGGLLQTDTVLLESSSMESSSLVESLETSSSVSDPNLHECIQLSYTAQGEASHYQISFDFRQVVLQFIQCIHTNESLPVIGQPAHIPQDDKLQRTLRGLSRDLHDSLHSLSGNPDDLDQHFHQVLDRLQDVVAHLSGHDANTHVFAISDHIESYTKLIQHIIGSLQTAIDFILQLRQRSMLQLTRKIAGIDADHTQLVQRKQELDNRMKDIQNDIDLLTQHGVGDDVHGAAQANIHSDIVMDDLSKDKIHLHELITTIEVNQKNGHETNDPQLAIHFHSDVKRVMQTLMELSTKYRLSSEDMSQLQMLYGEANRLLSPGTTTATSSGAPSTMISRMAIVLSKYPIHLSRSLLTAMAQAISTCLQMLKPPTTTPQSTTVTAFPLTTHQPSSSNGSAQACTSLSSVQQPPQTIWDVFTANHEYFSNQTKLYTALKTLVESITPLGNTVRQSCKSLHAAMMSIVDTASVIHTFDLLQQLHPSAAFQEWEPISHHMYSKSYHASQLYFHKSSKSHSDQGLIATKDHDNKSNDKGDDGEQFCVIVRASSTHHSHESQPSDDDTPPHDHGGCDTDAHTFVLSDDSMLLVQRRTDGNQDTCSPLVTATLTLRFPPLLPPISLHDVFVQRTQDSTMSIDSHLQWLFALFHCIDIPTIADDDNAQLRTVIGGESMIKHLTNSRVLIEQFQLQYPLPDGVMSVDDDNSHFHLSDLHTLSSYTQFIHATDIKSSFESCIALLNVLYYHILRLFHDQQELNPRFVLLSQFVINMLSKEDQEVLVNTSIYKQIQTPTNESTQYTVLFALSFLVDMIHVIYNGIQHIISNHSTAVSNSIQEYSAVFHEIQKTLTNEMKTHETTKQQIAKLLNIQHSRVATILPVLKSVMEIGAEPFRSESLSDAHLDTIFSSIRAWLDYHNTRAVQSESHSVSNEDIDVNNAYLSSNVSLHQDVTTLLSHNLTDLYFERQKSLHLKDGKLSLLDTLADHVHTTGTCPFCLTTCVCGTNDSQSESEGNPVLTRLQLFRDNVTKDLPLFHDDDGMVNKQQQSHVGSARIQDNTHHIHPDPTSILDDIKGAQRHVPLIIDYIKTQAEINDKYAFLCAHKDVLQSISATKTALQPLIESSTGPFSPASQRALLSQVEVLSGSSIFTELSASLQMLQKCPKTIAEILEPVVSLLEDYCASLEASPVFQLESECVPNQGHRSWALFDPSDYLFKTNSHQHEEKGMSHHTQMRTAFHKAFSIQRSEDCRKLMQLIPLLLRSSYLDACHSHGSLSIGEDEARVDIDSISQFSHDLISLLDGSFTQCTARIRDVQQFQSELRAQYNDILGAYHELQQLQVYVQMATSAGEAPQDTLNKLQQTMTTSKAEVAAIQEKIHQLQTNRSGLHSEQDLISKKLDSDRESAQKLCHALQSHVDYINTDYKKAIERESILSMEPPHGMQDVVSIQPVEDAAAVSASPLPSFIDQVSQQLRVYYQTYQSKRAQLQELTEDSNQLSPLYKPLVDFTKRCHSESNAQSLVTEFLQHYSPFSDPVFCTLLLLHVAQDHRTVDPNQPDFHSCKPDPSPIPTPTRHSIAFCPFPTSLMQSPFMQTLLSTTLQLFNHLPPSLQATLCLPRPIMRQLLLQEKGTLNLRLKQLVHYRTLYTLLHTIKMTHEPYAIAYLNSLSQQLAEKMNNSQEFESVFTSIELPQDIAGVVSQCLEQSKSQYHHHQQQHQHHQNHQQSTAATGGIYSKTSTESSPNQSNPERISLTVATTFTYLVQYIEKLFSWFIAKIDSVLSKIEGTITLYLEKIDQIETLLHTKFQNIESTLYSALLRQKVYYLAILDHDTITKSLEKALLAYHETKLQQINLVLGQYWRSCYYSKDITDIYIKCDVIIDGNLVNTSDLIKSIHQSPDGTSTNVAGSTTTTDENISPEVLLSKMSAAGIVSDLQTLHAAQQQHDVKPEGQHDSGISHDTHSTKQSQSHLPIELIQQLYQGIYAMGDTVLDDTVATMLTSVLDTDYNKFPHKMPTHDSHSVSKSIRTHLLQATHQQQPAIDLDMQYEDQDSDDRTPDDADSQPKKGRKQPSAARSQKKTTTKQTGKAAAISTAANPALQQSTVIPRLSSTKRYQYRLCAIQNGIEVDLRGRCSSGQRQLISLLVRISLAIVFTGRFTVLTLDEPTANMDQTHVKLFAKVICDLVNDQQQQYLEQRQLQSMQLSAFESRGREHHSGGFGVSSRSNYGIQFIIITHDPTFVEMLHVRGTCDSYYTVQKNVHGYSTIERVRFQGVSDLSDLHASPAGR